MPKSKRDKKVTLSKIGKKSKSREAKEAYVSKIRATLQDYPRIILIDIENPRNENLRMLKEELPNSCLLIGKNRLLCLAMGRDRSQSLLPQLYRLASDLQGTRCLLLTQHSLQEVLDAFEGPLRQTEYARSGFHPVQKTIRVAAGSLTPFCHTQEPLLRQLGLDTKLDKSIVILNKETVLCKKGDTLTPEQCRLLKLFEQPLAEFRFHALRLWENGKVKTLAESLPKSSRTSMSSKVNDEGDMEMEMDGEENDDGDDDDALVLVSQTLQDGTHYFAAQ